MAKRKPTAGRPGASDGGRREVLDAAARAFMHGGYTGTSMDDIADMLNATKGRIYHYYRSKLDIFLDIHVVAMEDLLAAAAPVAASDRSPAEKLRELVRLHAVAMMRNLPWERVAVLGTEMHTRSADTDKQRRLSARVLAMRDQYEQLFADIIDAGVKSGAFRQVAGRHATKPILGGLNWITVWYTPRADDGKVVEAIAAEFAEFAVRGLLK